MPLLLCRANSAACPHFVYAARHLVQTCRFRYARRTFPRLAVRFPGFRPLCNAAPLPRYISVNLLDFLTHSTCTRLPLLLTYLRHTFRRHRRWLDGAGAASAPERLPWRLNAWDARMRFLGTHPPPRTAT